jgi:RimJ/RimL family protein N-acetyltransferase
MIETERLLLVPYTYDLVAATLQGKEKLEKVLGYGVSTEWPNSKYLKRIPAKKTKLEKNPESSIWSRIVIEKESGTLIGDIGCKGGPDSNGIVEIGYSIVPSVRNKGYATEMVIGLTKWLYNHPSITKIIAECLESNEPSAKVLEKSGFKRVRSAEGMIYWENI